MVRALVLVLSAPAVAATLALGGCGYRPPAGTSASAPGYAADYAACDASVPDAVNKRNSKTGLAWFASPVRRWGMIDEGMSACMAEKGWGRVRACTPEELRAGGRSGGLSVTARGVQCADPPKR